MKVLVTDGLNFDMDVNTLYAGKMDFDDHCAMDNGIDFCFNVEKIYNGEGKDYDIKVLTRILRRIQKNMSGKAYELFSKFIEKGNIGKFADELKNNIENDFIDTRNILRNEEFQNLLVNYLRNDKSFIRAVDYVDGVTSGRVNRYDGTSTTTKDYLNEFCGFVKNNKEQVEAIKLLFNSPKDWNTSALKEINDLFKAK